MKTTKIFFSRTICVLAAVLSLQIGYAQDITTNATSVGMANTGVSTARGVEALGINPAAMVLPGLKRASISIFPIGIFAGSDFMDMETYKKYFTGVDDGSGKRTGYYLTESDKSVILATFTDDIGHFSTNIGYKIIAGTITTGIGTFGFNISDRIAANLTVPGDYADFLLNGNTPGKTFDLSKTEVNSWWARDYSASYSQQVSLQLMKVSAGVSVKLVQGFGYFGTEKFNSSFTTDPDSFVITGRAQMLAHYAGTEFLVNMTKSPGAFELFPSPVGSGLGFDVGMLAEVNDMVSIGAGITDIGSMTWNRNAKEISVDEPIYLSDFSSGSQFNDLQTQLNGKEKSVSSFTTPLPTTLHLGLSVKLPHFIGSEDRVLLAASLKQGFNNQPGTSTWARIGLGAEWRPITGIPLRTGVSFGGYTPIAISAGIGFHIGDKFMLDFSTDNLGIVLNQSASAASLAFGMHFEF